MTPRATTVRILRAVAGIIVLVLLVGLLAIALLRALGGQDPPDDADPAPTGPAAPDGPDLHDPAYDAAVSRTREDSVYPNMGEPMVDALHYALDLAWEPETRLLEGTATITLRAARRTDHLRLDLGAPLEVDAVTLDGVDVEWQHNGKDLVVLTPVTRDARHRLQISYAGSPEPVPAPTTRRDLDTLGWTVTPEGEVWTMQEPYGAHSWYPVHDQPSDKALYDFTIRAPREWIGVANGDLVARATEDGRTVTRWRMPHPTASYLVTIAIGDLVETTDESASGVPISYWAPPGETRLLERLAETPAALDWAEERLGPYPYDKLGVVLVESSSGMETQTMITLGRGDHTTSPAVLLHEIVHHWYGNLVTPTDWRDLWMNEGMATYLQAQFEADRAGIGIDSVLDAWAAFEPTMRAESGPPGAYDPTRFAEGNVYYGPALMWHEVRERVGDRAFWSMVRAWPASRAHGNADRRQYLAWVEEHTGTELTDLFDAWLLGETTPPR